MTRDILSVLDGKWEDGTRPADLYEKHIAARPSDYVEAILTGLDSKKKRVQGGCAEIASRLSADHPELLYPHLGIFLRNLKAKEPILRWEAVCVVGNLASVDNGKIIPKHLDAMVSLLSDKSIVLQGHAVRALAKVAGSNPKMAPGILRALLSAARFFPGTRVGYIIEATEAFVGHGALVPSIQRFLIPYSESEHAPVARKAKRALKQIASR